MSGRPVLAVEAHPAAAHRHGAAANPDRAVPAVYAVKERHR
jgi:hypothetical protein